MTREQMIDMATRRVCWPARRAYAKRLGREAVERMAKDFAPAIRAEFRFTAVLSRLPWGLIR